MKGCFTSTCFTDRVLSSSRKSHNSTISRKLGLTLNSKFRVKNTARTYPRLGNRQENIRRNHVTQQSLTELLSDCTSHCAVFRSQETDLERERKKGEPMLKLYTWKQPQQLRAGFGNSLIHLKTGWSPKRYSYHFHNSRSDPGCNGRVRERYGEIGLDRNCYISQPHRAKCTVVYSESTVSSHYLMMRENHIF